MLNEGSSHSVKPEQTLRSRRTPASPRLEGKDRAVGPCYSSLIAFPSHREEEMSICLRRRKFIVAVGSAAAWPLVARAQQPRMPVIGFLGLGSPNPSSPFAVAFREGLAEAGYVPGQNVATEFRWANAQASLLPQLAAELVDRKVAVIVTIGSR